MRKLLLISLFTLSCVSLRGQTLPIAAHLVWTQADLLSASVTNFTVQPDNNAPVNVDPTTCQQVTPFTCSLSISITFLGQHTYTITAYNAFGPGPATVFTATVSIPGKSNNVKITVP